MKKILSVILSMLPALFILQSCENATDNADFYAPSSYDDLPEYTEYGYNTAGARFTTTIKAKDEDEDEDEDEMIDQLWRLSSSPGADIAKQEDGMVTFSMSGVRTPYVEGAGFSFTFAADLDTLTDLRKLSNTQYSMQGGTLSARIELGNAISQSEDIITTSASLEIKRSRIIYTDYTDDGYRRRGVSLSGTFELTGTAPNGADIKVSNGRFDILFSGNNGTNFDNSKRN